MPTTLVRTTNDTEQSDDLLAAVVAATHATGDRLGDRFCAADRPDGPHAIRSAIDANDLAATQVLRPLLTAARPAAGWADDESAGGALPPGEWWVADPVEGNINHIHGAAGWGVTVALVRDNAVVLSVAHLPVLGTTYTAAVGRGAYQDGVRLQTSGKTNLSAAVVATGQATPGEDAATYRRIGESVTAMLHAALVTRVAVPATLELVEVAAGRMDAFWQFSAVRSGLLAGALLVSEAGGTVTDVRGNPWTPASRDLVAAAPGVHHEATRVLSTIA